MFLIAVYTQLYFSRYSFCSFLYRCQLFSTPPQIFSTYPILHQSERSLLRRYTHPFGLYERSLQPAHPPPHPARHPTPTRPATPPPLGPLHLTAVVPALRNARNPQTSCRFKKTWNSQCIFLRSWWRGGRHVIPAFLFNSARAARIKAILSMSVSSVRAQRLYSFHSRGRLWRFIRLAGWGFRLDVEAEGSSSSESDLTEFESLTIRRRHIQYLEHLEHLLCRMDWNRTRNSRNPAWTMDIAGWPFNTGRGQTQPTSCTLFSNIMVGKLEKNEYKLYNT